MATTTPNGTSEQIPIELRETRRRGTISGRRDHARLQRPRSALERRSRALGEASWWDGATWCSMPDSFSDAWPSRRRVHRLVTEPGRREPGARARRLRGARLSEGLSYVDGAHVGLMGGSHGGSTTLTSMIAPESDTISWRGRTRGLRRRGRAVSGMRGVAPHVEQYAGVYQPVAPLLILIGDKDDWTPAEPCRKLTDAAQQAGLSGDDQDLPGRVPLVRQLQPRALRRRDRVNPNAPGGRGATTVATRRPGPTASVRSSPSSAAICGSASPPSRPRSLARQRAIRRHDRRGAAGVRLGGHRHGLAALRRRGRGLGGRARVNDGDRSIAIDRVSHAATSASPTAGSIVSSTCRRPPPSSTTINPSDRASTRATNPAASGVTASSTGARERWRSGRSTRSRGPPSAAIMRAKRSAAAPELRALSTAAEAVARSRANPPSTRSSLASVVVTRVEPIVASVVP